MYTNDETQIVLENSKVFKKKINPVYPVEFTNWVSGIELKPNNRPDFKKPTKGVPKKWKDLPEIVENVRFYSVFRHKICFEFKKS